LDKNQDFYQVELLMNHLIERIKVYNEEKFNYDIVNIPLKS